STRWNRLLKTRGLLPETGENPPATVEVGLIPTSMSRTPGIIGNASVSGADVAAGLSRQPKMAA
ncbi:MAG: hypothetical protein ACRD1N_05930, partial [Terriglobia bacterium]